MKRMVIMTAPSGFGKSTLARQIKKGCEADGYCCNIFSTDDLFIVDGAYKFNPSKLGENHQRNKDRVYNACKDNVNVVIVDNTNLTLWEVKPYILIAKMFGYEVQFARPDKVEGTTNIHGVPEETIEKMINKMVPIQTMISFNEAISLACEC